MSPSVKVKIRPENDLNFPGICVHCGQPAGECMRISKRKRSITRLIDVPVCTNCFQEINRRSWAEERWQRIGLLVTGAVGVTAILLGFFLLPSALPVWLRLLAGIILAGLVVLGLRGIFRQRSAEVARPEKLAILASARMDSFTWRATTFHFSREDFSEQFCQLNEQQLMEN
ncbi:MAG TPA: hypothetical protein VMZ24_07645 [Patescibacteria group bacterium]|nr:hypothetical protein [Patescibacteria group bacterium]